MFGRKRSHEAAVLTTEVDYAGRQIVGQRSNQEDCYGIVPPDTLGKEDSVLLIVADGMGGHSAGEVASGIVVETFSQSFLEAKSDLQAARLWDALEEANLEVARAIESDPGTLEGMGTTLVAVLIRGSRFQWISVGDSLLFLVRDGAAKRLNAAHLWAHKLDEDAREGRITEAEAKADPRRPTLNSALVGESIFEVDDSDEMELRQSDILVVATDGIEALADEELASACGDFNSGPADRIAEEILNLVKSKEKPNQDNSTVVVFKVPSQKG